MSELRIISGGQTGVDRAALDAALESGFACGGWCPKGRRAEDGPIAEHYPLRETRSPGYIRRTKDNVRDSEATLILINDPAGEITGGTGLTVEHAEKIGRALLIVNMADGAAADAHVVRIANWVGDNRISVLNVAGPRESGSPGIYEAAFELMTALLAKIGHDQP